MDYNLFATPKLTKPVHVFDPTKSVADNMAGKGEPTAQNIATAYSTPQAQLQLAKPQGPVQEKYEPVLDTSSSTAGMDYLNSLYTDPNEEKRLRKASVMNQRILAIGDAVRHIGNIANTVGYAPSQQFNDPVALEQARYEKGKALRDKANLTYLTYQQQKAAQDAAQRKWEQQYGLQQSSLASQNAYRQVQTKLAAERIKLQRDLAEARKASDAARVKKIEAEIKRIEELLPGEKELQNARINQANAGAESSRASADLNKEKKEHPEKFRSGGGSVGGYMTVKKRRVFNPYSGKFEVVADTATRTPLAPPSIVGNSYIDGSAPSIGWDDDDDDDDNNGLEIGW